MSATAAIESIAYLFGVGISLDMPNSNFDKQDVDVIYFSWF